jgi:N-methylhydantoinase A
VQNGKLTDQDVADVASAFEDLYERQFGKGTGYKDTGFQFITYRVFATGHLASKPQLPAVPPATSQTPPLGGTRRAFLDSASGWTDTAIYNYKTLRAGHRVRAPAIIEASTTTVVIPAGYEGVVDSLGNLVITRDGEHRC